MTEKHHLFIFFNYLKKLMHTADINSLEEIKVTPTV